MPRHIYNCPTCKKGWLRTYIKDGCQHWRYIEFEPLRRDDIFKWRRCPKCMNTAEYEA